MSTMITKILLEASLALAADTSLRYPPLGRDFTQDELAAITKRLRMQAAVDRATGFDRPDEESE